MQSNPEMMKAAMSQMGQMGGMDPGMMGTAMDQMKNMSASDWEAAQRQMNGMSPEAIAAAQAQMAGQQQYVLNVRAAARARPADRMRGRNVARACGPVRRVWPQRPLWRFPGSSTPSPHPIANAPFLLCRAARRSRRRATAWWPPASTRKLPKSTRAPSQTSRR